MNIGFEKISLATAEITVFANNNQEIKLRALCDNGSQVNLISQKTLNSNHLFPTKQKTSFFGIEGTKIGTSSGEIELEIKSPNSTETIKTRFFVIKTITNYSSINQRNDWKMIENNLADPNFYKAGRITALLGVEVWSKIIQPNIIKTKNGIAQLTRLGYVIYQNENKEQNQNHLQLGALLKHEPIEELNNQLRKFWEIENVNSSQLLTQEEEQCEEIFSKNHYRDEKGRYVERYGSDFL